ncbi:MAG: DUF455 family protein [Leptospiraceae bacterium]|nr:DUF455 family protein [Leptospiraceae bacterium]MCP5512829.1 DUF455 family protein [Leptospiraceae bacterium]
MKTLNEYCNFLLKAPNLEDKLLPPPGDLIDEVSSFSLPDFPGRSEKIQFSDKKSKIPRLEHMNLDSNRGLALHHFANHELMAIELFAWAILKFQEISPKSRQILLKTLEEEQIHFRLYLERMREFGIDFGDRPLNSIFWKFRPLMSSFEKFTSIVSLSLEGANLDFAIVYRNTFSHQGDEKTASIMDRIYRDECKHVRRGIRILKNRPDPALSEWEYYLSLLEHPFTPRRAKGYFFLPFTRKKVGFSEEFIQKLGEYRDEFSNRKKEVIPEDLKSWGIYSG